MRSTELRTETAHELSLKQHELSTEVGTEKSTELEH